MRRKQIYKHSHTQQIKELAAKHMKSNHVHMYPTVFTSIHTPALTHNLRPRVGRLWPKVIIRINLNDTEIPMMHFKTMN